MAFVVLMRQSVVLLNNADELIYRVRARNAAKLCQAGVIPMGTAKAPTANVMGAAHIVER